MRARAAAALLGTVAVSSVLTACTRPAPYITLQTGSNTFSVSPQVWCFDQNQKNCQRNDHYNPRTIHAAAGSTILIDVPAVVASQHWLATAYVDNNGQQQTLDAASSSFVSDRHSTRVQVPQDAAGGSYILAVKSTTGQYATGVWGVVVQVTS